ncbi:MAG: 3-phenylpropionate MFS transporter, partial [Enterobacteriaceae bacterium]
FNFISGPLAPLSDALAGIWQQQIRLDYGKARLWGSLAFIVGTLAAGFCIERLGTGSALILLLLGLVAMLSGMLLRPTTAPTQSDSYHAIQATPWLQLLRESAVWRLLLLAGLLQGAHAAYYSFSAIYWQEAGYSSKVVGYLWSLGVISEMIFFAFSNKLVQHWSIKGLLIFSIVCGVMRWSVLALTTDLTLLVLSQILHCGTFSACHVAVIRFISARQGPDVIRLQAVYSSLCNGAGIALVTMLAGLLYTHIGSGIFWVMLLLVLPAIGLLPGRTVRT